MAKSSLQTQIVIDPRSSYAYGSFYLYGLIKLFGKHNVRFSLTPFKSLPEIGWNMRFVAINGNHERKYFIHTNDTYTLQTTDYEWCDVYGHVNANFTHTPLSQYPKIVSLVPSFAIRTLSATSAMQMALLTFIEAAPFIVKRAVWNKYINSHEVNVYKNIKHHFGRIYKTTNNRLPYSDYTKNSVSTDDYIFFCSTLWYDHPDNQNDVGVNLRRAHFMRACKNIPDITFEGGFVADTTSSKEKFADLLTTGVSMSEWLEKTRHSALVFNTPAFWNCHGWKLGEYLALGKCIVSTPLSNDLPTPLEHGVNIHFVESDYDAIYDAVKYILSNSEYRLKLEHNARLYWEQYGTPTQALHLLGL